MSEQILNILCSSKKIERDGGVVHLHKMLSSNDPEERICLETRIIQMLTNSDDTPWETKQGCLLGSKEIIQRVDLNNERELEFISKITDISRKLLTDIEVRVRLESGEVFGALCQKIGPTVYEEEKEFVLNLILVNLERQVCVDDSSRIEQIESEKLFEKLVGNGQRRNSADAAQIFHDTAGWKNLETSLKCLQAMVLGCGTKFQPYVNQELLNLLFRTTMHTNRFVRETGFYVFSALVKCGNTEKGKELDTMCDTNPIYVFGHEFSQHLALGLADNWSQVRLAASDATRHFLLALPSSQARETFYPQLLPQMCLNRYYIAEGVRIYSQETWRQVMGSHGRSMVQRYIAPTVTYYTTATQSDNHAVREAACACIAELASKIDQAAVRPFVQVLLDTLLTCFQDDSWPVRDAACLACGHFILCFSEESAHSLEALYPLFFANLGDPISSVRQGAATSLGNVVRAYGHPALQIVLEQAKSYLGAIKDQPAETDKYTQDSCEGQARFGVIKRQRDNDMDLHTDQQMYSCGSLAPKMGRGGGCSNHKFNRPSQPWEKADGCVYLLGELSSIPEASKEVLKLLPLLANACQYQHYPQHVVLLETVCKQLPSLAKHLGVRAFKAYLDLFLDPVFRSIESENALTSSAASQCLNQLSSLIGPNILRARVNNYNPRYLDRLDANIFIAPF
uniref:TOG domain-containing protein n=1 Tax=Cuerna arida TaxID=1464854 RepID=A0A1B6GJM3_9HEMI